MKTTIVEKGLYIGLLLSMLALAGVVILMLAYMTLALIKMVPVAGYAMVVAVVIGLIVEAIKNRGDGGIMNIVAGIIYILALLLI